MDDSLSSPFGYKFPAALKFGIASALPAAAAPARAAMPRVSPSKQKGLSSTRSSLEGFGKANHKGPDAESSASSQRADTALKWVLGNNVLVLVQSEYSAPSPCAVASMNITWAERSSRAFDPLTKKNKSTKSGVWFHYLAGPLSKAIKVVASFVDAGYLPIMTALFPECAVRNVKGTGENARVYVYEHHQCVQDAFDAKLIDAIHEPARVAMRSFLLNMFSVIVMTDIPNAGMGLCAYHVIDAVWERNLLHASIRHLPSCVLAQQVRAASPSISLSCTPLNLPTTAH